MIPHRRELFLTSAVWQILHVRSETLDDRILVSILRQAPVDLVGELLHNQPELLVRQDEVLAGISYLRINVNGMIIMPRQQRHWSDLETSSRRLRYAYRA